jgi:hypothetical protein
VIAATEGESVKLGDGMVSAISALLVALPEVPLTVTV